MELNLLALPSEILTLICLLADPQDLKAARKACRALHNAATKPFGEVFFASRAHIITWQSLNQLVLMSANPKVGPYIRSLAFNCIFAPDPRYADSFRQSIKADPWLAVLGARYRQHSFVCDEGFTAALKHILENLKTRGSQPINVHIYGNKDLLDGWGSSILLSELDMSLEDLDPRSPRTHSCMPNVAAACARAINDTRYPVNSLILDTTAHGISAVKALSTLNIRNKDRFHAHHLPSKEVVIRRPRQDSSETWESLRWVPEEALLEVQHSQTTSLPIDLVELATWPPKNSITKLVVKDSHISRLGEFIVFSQRHSKLKYLEMHSCRVQDDSWSIFFRKFSALYSSQALINLEYCRFTDLKYDQSKESMCPGLVAACHEVHEFRGRAEVEQGIPELIERFKMLEAENEKFSRDVEGEVELVLDAALHLD